MEGLPNTMSAAVCQCQFSTSSAGHTDLLRSNNLADAGHEHRMVLTSLAGRMGVGRSSLSVSVSLSHMQSSQPRCIPCIRLLGCLQSRWSLPQHVLLAATCASSRFLCSTGSVSSEKAFASCRACTFNSASSAPLPHWNVSW